MGEGAPGPRAKGSGQLQQGSVLRELGDEAHCAPAAGEPSIALAVKLASRRTWYVQVVSFGIFDIPRISPLICFLSWSEIPAVSGPSQLPLNQTSSGLPSPQSCSSLLPPTLPAEAGHTVFQPEQCSWS